MPESNFFTEEASRQILLRVANFFNDPDLCDAVFVVSDEDKTEEICAPSQFMAISSPYFKKLFYPPRENDDKKREVKNMAPQIFRKVLDYLFRGKVPLNSIDDAWRVKVAGRTFDLKELEELTTKFLKYRLDSQNLLTYLKSSFKYKCPDMREVVTTRFLKEAINILDNPTILELSQEELLSLIEREPEVQGKKLMSILIKWAKKRYGIADITPVAESESCEKDMKPMECGDKASTTEEKKTPEEKKTADESGEEKKEETVAADSKTEEQKTQETQKPKEPEKPNLVTPLQPFMKYLKWDHGDAEYFLQEVHNCKIMMEEDENRALEQMLQSYVDRGVVSNAPITQMGKRQPTPQPRGRSGARQAPEKGPMSGPDVSFAGERRSKTPGSGGIIVDKTDDDIILS